MSGLQEKFLNDILSTISSGKTDQVDLRTCKPTDEFLYKLFDLLESNEDVKKLIFGPSRLKSNHCAQLRRVLEKNAHLIELDLTANKLDSGILEIFEGLKRNQSIETLWLTSISLSSDCARKLDDALRYNSHIRSLNLQKCQLGDIGSQIIASCLSSHSFIMEIDLTENSISDSSMEAWKQCLTTNKSLTILDFSDNKISDVGLSTLSIGIGKNQSLRSLLLSSNKLKNLTPQLTLALQSNKSLSVLSFRSNEITYSGIECIQNITKNGNIQELDLGVLPLESSILDNGIELICNSLSHNSILTSLDLSFTRMTMKGINSLVKLCQQNVLIESIKLDNVQHAHLVANALSDPIRTTKRMKSKMDEILAILDSNFTSGVELFLKLMRSQLTKISDQFLETTFGINANVKDWNNIEISMDSRNKTFTTALKQFSMNNIFDSCSKFNSIADDPKSTESDAWCCKLLSFYCEMIKLGVPASNILSTIEREKAAVGAASPTIISYVMTCIYSRLGMNLEVVGYSLIFQSCIRFIPNQSDFIPKWWISENHAVLLKSLKDLNSKPNELLANTTTPIAASKSELEKHFERIKTEHPPANLKALEELMTKYSGLDEVKARFLSIFDLLLIQKKQGFSVQMSWHARFDGNPGSGKTTVAKLYAQLLQECGIQNSNSLSIDSTGQKLGDLIDGPKLYADCIQKLNAAGGGVFFIDEAYQMMSNKQVLNLLLVDLENLRDKVVFILAGYKSDMEKLFETNDGFPSRIPRRNWFHFPDFSDEQLLDIFKGFFKKEADKLKFADEKHSRIAIQRLGKNRGSKGFGNGRDVRNLFQTVIQRQRERLGKLPNDPTTDLYTVSRDDILGPKWTTTEFKLKSKSYAELQKLVGLKIVKDRVNELIEFVVKMREDEENEKPTTDLNLNQVFIGNPGTGKTTVAKLYGNLLCELGLLSKGDMEIKGPSDFVGTVLGQSEEKTRSILDNAKGNALLIDEAYSLYAGGSVGNSTDPYKKAVIDTIVDRVQVGANQDRAIILAGYKDQMKEFFEGQGVNPGLARRFNWTNPFEFEDYNDEELGDILVKNVCSIQKRIPMNVVTHALSILARQRILPKFGNGGAVKQLVDLAVVQLVSRTGRTKEDESTLTISDFNEASKQQHQKSTLPLNQSLQDLQAEYSAKITSAKRKGRHPLNLVQDDPPLINLGYRFIGPPGTGKTSSARQLGEILAGLKLISKSDVHEIAAKDLVTGFAQQAGKKTTEIFDQSIGGILFIDEAYDLIGNVEVVNTIVALMTNPKYVGKMAVVIAGYASDISSLLQMNSGLERRFPEVIEFQPWSSMQATKVLFSLLERENKLDTAITLDAVSQSLSKLAIHPSWASGGDIRRLWDKIFANYAIRTQNLNESDPPIQFSDIEQAIKRVLEQKNSSNNIGVSNGAINQFFSRKNLAPAPFAQSFAPRFNTSTSHAIETKTTQNNDEGNFNQPLEISESIRDQGVSDEVWIELERSKQEFIKREEERRQIEAELKRLAEEEAKRKAELERAAAAERERIEKELRKLAEEKARMEAIQREMERERQKEIQRQQQLARMGVCPAGYQWYKVGGGYRCGGGSHYISNASLS